MPLAKKSLPRANYRGFTIVELLIVIVVIGILAAITIVAYIGVQQRATVATLTSDLVNASTKLKLFQVDNAAYPGSMADCPTPASGNLCLKASSGNAYTSLQTGVTAGLQTFCLNIKHGTTRYRLSSDSTPVAGVCLGVTSGLVAYYPLDSDAKDSSGNGRDGTVSGATPAAGAFNGAYGFNSPTTYINLPSDLGYSGSVSAFAWFKAQGTPGSNFHIVFGGQELEISIPTDGSIRTGVFTDTRYVSNAGSGLLDGSWHFVGLTFDGTTKKSYIDGVDVGQQTVIGTLVNVFASRRIGVYGSSTGYYANGLIDEARIYNRALTASEVTTLYGL